MTGNEETILPDSIAIANDVRAFDIAVKQQLDTVDVSKVLLYMVDQVDARALPMLADQFDVLGYKGMRLAVTEPDQRNLIKKAIELHRYKGTIYAVKEAMKAVGFADAVIVEHVSGHWANFSVNLLNAGVGITADTIASLIKMINEYKNTRSNLVVVNMDLLVEDELYFGDLAGTDFDEAYINESFESDDNLVLSNKLFYDGSADYDGSNDHSGDSDVVLWV